MVEYSNFITHIRHWFGNMYDDAIFYPDGRYELKPKDFLITNDFNTISSYGFAKISNFVYNLLLASYTASKPVKYNNSVNLPSNIYNVLFGNTVRVDCHSQLGTALLYQNNIAENDNYIIYYCSRLILSSMPALNHNKKIILIINDSDEPLTQIELDLINQKINPYLILASNLQVHNGQTIPIPLGIRDATTKEDEELIKSYILFLLNMGTKAKKFNIYVNFNTYTSQERIGVLDICKQNNITTSCRMVPKSLFLAELNQHYFCLSPDSGHGGESSKMWESLYLGTIPIVVRSKLTEFYSAIFPMIILDRWENLAQYKFTQDLYIETMNKYPDYKKYLDCGTLFQYLISTQRPELLT